MVYSNLYRRKNKKMLVIFSLVAVAVVSLWLFLFIRDLGLKNGWEKTSGIDRLQVVNISPNGFDVVWTTTKQFTEDQWIEWKADKGADSGKTAVENIGDLYRSSLSGLTPGNAYSFKVRVGTKTFVLNDLVQNHIVLPKASPELPISPAYGKVMLPTGKPYANGLLVYEVDGFYPIATLTKSTGEWLLPLTGLVNKKTNAVSSLSDNFSVTIRLFSYPQGTIRTTVGQTRPLGQAITAGKSLQIAKREENPAVLGATTSNGYYQSNPEILYPKENALIPGNQPLMRGTAIPGKDVLALIAGPKKQYSYRTSADSKGQWLIQYPLPLEFGHYTFSVSTVDRTGAPITLRRTFSIIKSGEQVLGEATASPTLIPTVSPVPTIIANITPTILPTMTPAPTVIAYISPTALPTVVPTRMAPTNAPPVTGGGMTGFAYAAVFCIVVGAGLVLAF